MREKDVTWWINNNDKIHLSNVVNAYKISEILEVVYLNASRNKQIEMPFPDDYEGNTIDLLNISL